jgi:predicted dehydrogenase
VTPLRFAVIGCGAIATSQHLPALARRRDARLVAVVDRDLGWARTIGRRFGAELAAADAGELGGRVDAAIVATPNATHVPVASDLLGQDVHVLCEKPLATTVEAARELLETAQRTRTRVMAAHVRRFQPNLVAAHRLVRDGVIGRPTSLHVEHSSPRGQWASRTAYRSERSLSGGGVLIELGVHLVDLAIWFLGREIVDVEGTVECDGDLEVESDARLTLGFASGAVAGIAVSDRRTLDPRLVLRGTGGWLEVGQSDDAPVTVFGRGARACRIDGAQRIVPGAGDPFAEQLDAFCRCLRTGAPWPVPDDEVLLGLEVITGVYTRLPPALESAR